MFPYVLRLQHHLSHCRCSIHTYHQKEEGKCHNRNMEACCAITGARKSVTRKSLNEEKALEMCFSVNASEGRIVFAKDRTKA